MTSVARYLALGAACLSLPVQAGGVEQLRAFLESTRSGKAEFTQTVTSNSSGKPQEASGTMVFSRPGKFRWTYDKPYYQLIVGDGEKLWVYDKDLNQVTVKKLGQALGSSPAALLTGDNAWEKNFVLKDAGRSGGLDVVQATPKGQDGTFEWVRLGFSGNLPQVMELRDNFGQTTTLHFARFERNPGVDADQFRFVPPKGADVIGE